MKETLTISKEIEDKLQPEFSRLKDEGMQYILELASAIWTDYNVHDPGVTTLEMLCYVLTDLNYRIALPVENILAVEENNTESMHGQFLSAIKILPGNPITPDDYRQLLVRVDGVRNAWISKSAHKIIANYKQTDGKPLLHYAKPAEVPMSNKEIEFDLNGLTNILLDFEEFPEFNGDAIKIKAKQEAIIQEIKSIYHYYRSLCEDLGEIKAVEKQEVVLCADIELEASADPELIWAKIIFNVEQYFSPNINFYSLKELLEKDMQADEIFEGPVFDYANLNTAAKDGLEATFSKQGFMIPAELAASQLRSELRLSDIYRIIMEIDGVKLVKRIAFGFCRCSEPSSVIANKIYSDNAWLLCVEAGFKPVLCENNSSFSFYKDVIPVKLKKLEAKTELDTLRIIWANSVKSKLIEDLPIPDGDYRDVGHYETLQSQFQENYGISQAGLPNTASEERRSLALQLKAYLLFFDQVLANYFSQLSNVRTLLTADESIRKTYFSNVITGIPDVDKLLDGSDEWLKTVDDVIKSTAIDNYAERKNKFLDHLLSRFAEQFNEYVFLMYRIYGEDYQRNIIRNKVNFLKNYDQMSVCRGGGRDIYNAKTDDQEAVNVSGMEKRISNLLGFTNYKLQTLAKEDYLLFKADATYFNFSITQNTVVAFKGLANYLKEIDAYEDLGLVSVLAGDRENYLLKPGPTAGKVIYDIVDSKGNQHTFNDMEIDGDTAEVILSSIIDFMRNKFKMEGMYVIENILLRPPLDYAGDDTTNRQFMPVCIDPNGIYCKPLDPYSFRICVILPGYSLRLRNIAFRAYAERLIRMETPAHILPRICFIGHDQMVDFENMYKKWREAKQTSLYNNTPMDVTINTDFISLLESLYSRLPSRTAYRLR